MIVKTAATIRQAKQNQPSKDNEFGYSVVWFEAWRSLLVRLEAHDEIRVAPPCNVIVQETKDGKVELSAVGPVAILAAADNPSLRPEASPACRILSEPQILRPSDCHIKIKCRP